MKRFMRFLDTFIFKQLGPSYLLTLQTSQIEQEQIIAAQIVQVVIAGNSVEIPHGLLNGQVPIFFFHIPSELTIRRIFLLICCWSFFEELSVFG